MNEALRLRQGAEELAAPFPALLAEAEHLAQTVLLGAHGRRRAGVGDDFWQYRPALPWDEARGIDWRRSARADTAFVREREWQIAQSVLLWCDQGASMRYASTVKLPEKIDRARLLSLALAVLLVRGGERVGLTGTSLPPRRGRQQILRLTEMLTQEAAQDYAPPEHRALIPHARIVFVSDFLGDITEVELALTKAADRGARGIVLQLLDPAEESFPFRGRTIFESVGGTLKHETLKANDLKQRYTERLAARKDALQRICAATGWQYGLHHTEASAQTALLWLYRALEAQGR